MNKTCETYKWWRKKEDEGSCNRYPPQLQVVDGVACTLWPKTNRNEWCGEHTTDEVDHANKA